MRSGPSIEAVARQPVGTEIELLGTRTGSTRDGRCSLAIPGGIVDLQGSLRGATFNQPIRVRISVASRRALGLLPPVHELVSWEPIEPAG